MSADAVEILLVEDNPTDRELTLRALQKVNLANSVQVARDGAEALEMLLGSESGGSPVRPRVILLDLKLPKVDGIEVLRRMRADERTRLIPVVVLTSSHEEHDVLRSYELGTNSYVVKPVEFEAFAHAIAQLGLYWLLINRVLPR